MKIMTLSDSAIQTEVINLDDSQTIDKIKFAGQDSVVYRNILTNQAIHLYYERECTLEKVVEYAKCVNEASLLMQNIHYQENASLAGEEYKALVQVNPVLEVGERMFLIGNKRSSYVYSLSPFISANSLCWPGRTQIKEEQEVVKNFPIMFYDRLENYLYDNLPQITGIDINPVNVKYRVNRERKEIDLIITDIAKNINNISRVN